MKRNQISIVTCLGLLLLTGCEDHHGGKRYETCGDGELSSGDALWSHGEGDTRNSKRAPGIRVKGCQSGPVTAPSLQWKFEMGGTGTGSPPVIAEDGTIYIVGEYPGTPPGTGGVRNAGLFAISPEGNMKWFFGRTRVSQFSSGGILYMNSPAIGLDGTLYLGLWDSTFYALNPMDGSVKWQYRTDERFSANPVIDGNGLIYVGADTIYCFDPSGTVKWRYSDTSHTGSCRGLALGKTMLVGMFFRDGILALDYKGKKKWFYEEDIFAIRRALLIDESENIYCKADDGFLLSLDRNGKLRWTGGAGLGGLTAPVLRGDYLYFGILDVLYKLPSSSGTNAQVIAGFDGARYLSSEGSVMIDDNGNVYSTPGHSLACVSSDGIFLWDILIPEVIDSLNYFNDDIEFSDYIGLTPEGGLLVATFGTGTESVNRLYYLK